MPQRERGTHLRCWIASPLPCACDHIALEGEEAGNLLRQVDGLPTRQHACGAQTHSFTSYPLQMCQRLIQAVMITCHDYGTDSGGLASTFPGDVLSQHHSTPQAEQDTKPIHWLPRGLLATQLAGWQAQKGRWTALHARLEHIRRLEHQTAPAGYPGELTQNECTA